MRQKLIWHPQNWQNQPRKSTSQTPMPVLH
nr:MAG TPA: hypothetical protein [Caudoviricetes sp.]